MSKTIEFVERELKELKFQIEYIKYNMEKYVDFRSEGQLKIDEIQPKINALQDIKCELEAWEVFNNNVEIEEVEKINPFMQNTYKQYFIKGVSIYESEAIKIKKAKALEVEDEIKETD